MTSKFENSLEKIEELISTRVKDLRPISLKVFDKSHLHFGHDSFKKNALHILLEVKTSKFIGLSRLHCHRLIYKRLNDLIPFPFHAVEIEVKIPEKDDCL